METQIHVFILISMFPTFAVLSMLLIRNIRFLLHTKYQALVWHALEGMATNMTEGGFKKSVFSPFDLKLTFSFVIRNSDLNYRFLFVNYDW